jgi:acetoin utilization protein AcuC
MKQADPKAAFVYSEDCLKYNFGPSHVFRPERAYYVWKALEKTGLFDEKLELIPPIPATFEDLLLFHTERYVSALSLEDEGLLFEHGIGFGDNPYFEGIYEAVRIVAGATLTAAKMLLEGFDFAFAFSGGLHHAHPDYASGFCLVNDAVLAIKTFIERGFTRRGSIMYVDIDAHFGDGVVYGLYNRGEVVTLSVHESGRYLFPGTGFLNERGKGEGEGLKINVPLPPYSAEQEFTAFVDRVFKPAVLRTKPQIVVVQSGTDGYKQDPLTHLKYSPYSYLYFFRALKEVCREVGSKILVLGGGGYVPSFASLIWLAATLYLSHDLDFEETYQLALNNELIQGLDQTLTFEPEKSKTIEHYLEDFQTTIEKATSYTAELPEG